MPSVVILLLNWLGWQDTIQCLKSLEHVDYPDFRVVVVDNGSTNDSVAQLKHAFPALTLLETGSNLGFAGGNNRGILWALEQGADYVWLLNNDTEVDPGALKAMVDVAELDERIGAIGAVLYQMENRAKVQAYGGGRVSVWAGLQVSNTRPTQRLDYISGASLLIRRAAIVNVGLLDEGFFMYWEDGDYGFRLRNTGWKLATAPTAKVYHKESSSLGKKNPVLTRYATVSAKRFLKRYAPMPRVSLTIRTFLRFFKRVVQRDWEGALGTLSTGQPEAQTLDVLSRRRPL